MNTQTGFKIFGILGLIVCGYMFYQIYTENQGAMSWIFASIITSVCLYINYITWTHTPKDPTN